MNPYTYQRRAQKSRQKQEKRTAASFAFSVAKTVLGAELSALVAIAMVVFAAGSVVSLAMSVQSELAVAEFVEVPVTEAVSSRVAAPAVLGILANAPVSYQYYTGITTFAVTPFSYDAEQGRWEYEVTYALPEGLQQSPGSVSIGSWVIAQSSVSGDVVLTGPVLKPSTQYEMVVWSGPNKSGKRIASSVFVTESAPISTQLE